MQWEVYFLPGLDGLPPAPLSSFKILDGKVLDSWKTSIQTRPPGDPVQCEGPYDVNNYKYMTADRRSEKQSCHCEQSKAFAINDATFLS